MVSEADRRYMKRALELAERGLYTATPNPRVGCVVVRDGAVVGEGWHERAGGPHAEVNALSAAGGKAKGATAYVTLEPCAHQGRTPPCTRALAAAGISRVVAAMCDPNPLVSGRGLEEMRSQGIETQSGVMETEARELNVGFVSRMTRGRPWVRLKIAASLDGRTALKNGQSQWITGPQARSDGHHWRARACAIVTGIGTVRDDDPLLTVREVETQRQPTRVVIDSRLEISPAARIVGPGTVVAAALAEPERKARLEARGAEVIVFPNDAGKVDLPAFMRELARREMNELHVEAGYKLNGSLLREGLVDELLIYLAPTILGDAAHGMFHLPELTALSEARALELRDLARIGPEMRIIARAKDAG